MEFEILWSPEALDDLRSLTNFIAVDNPAAAEKVGSALITSTELLATQPLLGRRVPEQQSTNIREVIRAPYRIIYEVRRSRRTVEVLRIWHGARGTPEIS
ncbi:MAG TPA: type II toxin-antitoxin system RelE/ParE family toxin [Verrucomicrobiae bacterium]